MNAPEKMPEICRSCRFPAPEMDCSRLPVFPRKNLHSLNYPSRGVVVDYLFNALKIILIIILDFRHFYPYIIDDISFV